MKSRILSLLFLLAFPLMMSAQEVTSEQVKESESSFVKFETRKGSLFLRQFYDLVNLRTKYGLFDMLTNKEYVSLAVRILVMTDVNTKEQHACVRIKEGTRYIGTLDFDELDACVKSLDYMKGIVLNPTQNYTECIFSTNDKLELGVYCNEGKWSAFITFGRYLSEPTFHFNLEFLLALYDSLVKARDTIPTLLN